MVLALNLASVAGPEGQHLSGRMPSHDQDRAGSVDRVVIGYSQTGDGSVDAASTGSFHADGVRVS